MTKPNFISIQGGDYLINMAYVVSIETGPDEITVSMADGKDYTIENAQEIVTLMNALDVL